MAGLPRTIASPPVRAGWFQGNPYENFGAQSGSLASCIAANFPDGSGLAVISNWLLTPPVTLQNGAKFSFWTTTVPPSPSSSRTYSQIVSKCA